MTTLSHKEFLALTTLEELHSLYRERGFQGSAAECYRRAQEEWHKLALIEARKVTEPPAALDAIVCERQDVRYRVYGVIHGLIGGDDREYKDFVDKTVAGLERVIFENGLNYFYAHKESVVIPDFMVLGALGSLALGFSVGVQFPLLIWEMFRELLKPKRDGAAKDLFDYDPRYHGIDPETRRGVCEEPPLPSRLQIDYEMSAWDRGGLWARIRDPFAIVPRSLFMAGFAVGQAEARGDKEVAVVVGDLHSTEIQRFLEDPALEHKVFEAGRRFGKRQGFSRLLAFMSAKLIHLSFAGLAGAMVLLPFIVLIVYLLF